MNILSYCSFLNTVSLAGDVFYNFSFSVSSALKGMCAPGERVHLNAITRLSECAPFRSFPGAFERVIADASKSSDHERACGKWIQGGVAVRAPVYWAFYDDKPWKTAILHSTEMSYRGHRLANDDVGKFRSTCASTVQTGTHALRQSAQKAYSYLASGIVQPISNVSDGLHSLGWLASHYCDSPVAIGISLSSFYRRHSVLVSDGAMFAPGALSASLLVVDALHENQNIAEDAEAANAHVNMYSHNSPPTSAPELYSVVRGSLSHGANFTHFVGHRSETPQLDGLVHLANTGDFARVEAFLKGVAAFCSYTLSTSITELGATHTSNSIAAAAATRTTISRSKPLAAALGRLQPAKEESSLFEVSDASLFEASTITLSQLTGTHTGNAHTDCLSLTRSIFPDLLDRINFEAVFTDRLYTRLEEVVRIVRSVVEHTLRTNPTIRAVLTSPDTVADAVKSTKVSIPGAPRNSWAGASRDLPRADLRSDDGVFLMAIKHAREIYLDRIEDIVLLDSPVCTGPPIYDALSTNAYIYPGLHCSVYLLGMLRRPFADERYDNTSLFARIGYVVGHELAHNTMLSSYNQSAKNALLHRYNSNLHSEALADVVSLVALVENGILTENEACSHVSQLWCARVPPFYTHSTTSTHPGPNERGDALCATLRDVLAPPTPHD